MGLRIFPELLDELLRHSRTTEFEVVFAELQRSQQALLKVRYVVLNIMRQDPVIRVATAKQSQEPGRDQKYGEHSQSEQDDRAQLIGFQPRAHQADRQSRDGQSNDKNARSLDKEKPRAATAKLLECLSETCDGWCGH